VFEKNGLDYARCTWNVNCTTWYEAQSDGGTKCNSVIGTGCPGTQTTVGTLNWELQLPVGTQANAVDDYCKKYVPSYGRADAVCGKMSSVIEQYEDLCCVPRQPKPDGGVSYDASPDAGVDAAVDAAVDAGADAAVDAGTDAAADAGYDAGTDAGGGGWDAGFGALP
jgi:hypothetical protein